MPKPKTNKRNTAKKTKSKKPRANAQVAKKQMDKTPVTVVLFYAHWCGHCQAMYPEWEELKEELGADRDYKFVEVEHENIENQKPLLEKEMSVSPIQIQGFPTLVKIHPNKQVEYYEGERTKGEFGKWLGKTTASIAKPDEHSTIWQRIYSGGYKIPVQGKVKTYTKTKTRSRSIKSKSHKKIATLTRRKN